MWQDFWNEIESWIETVWGGMWSLDKRSQAAGWAILHNPEDPYYAMLSESLQRLRRRWTAEMIGQYAAEMIFNPVEWQREYHYHYTTGKDGQYRRVSHAMFIILTACLVEFPVPDLYSRIEKRLCQIMGDPFDNQEWRQLDIGHTKDYSPSYGHSAYLPPGIGDYLSVLMGLPPSKDNLELIEKIFSGIGSQSAYDIYRADYQVHLPALAQRLFEHGRLTYDYFTRAFMNVPNLVLCFPPWPENDPFHRRFNPPYPVERNEEFLNYAIKNRANVLQDVIARLTESNWAVLHMSYLLCQNRGLQGSQYLVEAATRHQEWRLNNISYSSNWKVCSVFCLARAYVEPENEADYQTLLATLKKFPAPILKALLPAVPSGQWRVLCEALGWDHALSLIQQLSDTAGRKYRDFEGYGQPNIPNSPDPACGVIDIVSAQEAIKLVGDALTKEIFALFKKGFEPVDRVILLFGALRGWKRTDIEQSLQTRYQPGIKAFGLLPLEGGNTELHDRYLRLKAFEAGIKKQGVQKRATDTGAVQAALTNLALNAGYADAQRLEWAMEVELSSPAVTQSRWAIQDYTVEIQRDGLRANLVVTRNGKVFKTIPKAVKDDDLYPEIKLMMERFKEQVERFKVTFQRYMIEETPLQPEDLQTIARISVALEVLKRLVLRTQDGIFGLYDAAQHALSDADGTPHPITTPVIMVHAYHLVQHGCLDLWQNRIVGQHIVQPFKQVFREVYVLTPAETETATYSSRFAHRTVKSTIAARLLESRDWKVDVPPCKNLQSLGCRAVLDFTQCASYFTGNITNVTGYIFFQPTQANLSNWEFHQERDVVPLSHISPVIFSEVMRDVDLVISVARPDDGEAHLPHREYEHSQEMMGHRSDVIRALARDLNLEGVHIKEHFVHVKGKRASYRIHLGSASVYIEPAHHLCIVPDRTVKQKATGLYLPFFDEHDNQTVEIISKMLLLLNDNQIKDPLIVRQIQQASP